MNLFFFLFFTFGVMSTGGSKEDTERLRYQAVMYQRLPPDANPATIESLDLSNAGMFTVDVSPYVVALCCVLCVCSVSAASSCLMHSDVQILESTSAAVAR